MSSRRTLLRNCLYGINVNEGPLYLASPIIREKLQSVLIQDNTAGLAILNGILYTIGHVISPQEDIVKTRLNDRRLERGVKEKWNGSASFWSGFLLTGDSETKKSYHSSSVVMFQNEDEENTHEYTRSVIDFAKTFGVSTISKLVPTAGKWYTVDVLSCESKSYDKVDQFELMPVNYTGYHPSFDFSPSIYKSFEKTEEVLNLADRHLTLPEAKKLIRLTKTYSNKSFTSKDDYPYPFIVVEGLDGVGKTTLVNNLAQRLDAKLLYSPPDSITQYREIMAKQCEPVCRAFYSLGNYLTAENIKDLLVRGPVVLDRFWHSSAAYAIALEAKCGSEANIPPKGHSIYQWPGDLLKPSAVIFLELSEEDRMSRLRERGVTETDEEMKLKKSRLLRQRLIQAYKNMENPSCISIDASTSKEEVCQNVIKALRNRNVLNVLL